MGLLNSAKEAIGLGGEDKSESDDIAEEWIDEVDSEVEESEELLDEPQGGSHEPADEEWDSAYKFAEEFLEVRGFASMVDFTNKCMAFKINKSPMYRDRISNGVNTMNQITSMQEQMSQIGGGNKKETSYEEKARKLESANKVIDEAQKLSGQEDAMVNELIGVGHELAESLAHRTAANRGGGDVNSSVSKSDEEL